jgi:hypothetical protein
MTLADRIERLDGPDAAIDELILLATGWTLERAKGLVERATWIDPQGERTAHRQGDGWFRPTASLYTAMTLVPEQATYINIEICARGLPGQHCRVEIGWLDQAEDEIRLKGYAKTEALALCCAALRAQEAEGRGR